ncbi:hypothetical protein COO58_17520 [Micromonospora sp. WMMA1996]|uniref:hypothetical protein n=1 Tax=Micromonospora sp. WMMA1996 TaxID=2039878 RepID=UPI000BF2DBB8|nr:hypothetical protein [Micromonospora sp. WMMA1996]PGH46009.1 hypothetical protein COO58_17520 [Micromonospora sp. WMMA1996]
MSNLPFALPTCDQPATTRLEVFSTTAGLPGSLDASVYVCEQHVDAATDAIEGTNRTVNRVRMAPDVHRNCGQVYPFPTGALAGPMHPAWCDRNDCDRRREHRSGPVEVDTNRPEPTIVNVGLVQAVDSDQQPQVVIAAVDTSPGGQPRTVQLRLSVSQGYVLSNRMRLLTDAVRRAGRDGGSW